MTQFFFTYHQIIPTAHPNFEVHAYFRVTAGIEGDGETVNILRVTGNSVFADHATPPCPLPIRNEASQAGAKFLEILREAGRQAYHEAQKAKP